MTPLQWSGRSQRSPRSPQASWGSAAQVRQWPLGCLQNRAVVAGTVPSVLSEPVFGRMKAFQALSILNTILRGSLRQDILCPSLLDY